MHRGRCARSRRLDTTTKAGEWLPPAAVAGAVDTPLPFTAEADAMHGALMRRADALGVCMESSDEEAECKAIVDLIEAYEIKR
jgi:methylmalonyl-CoA mutase cobalamin-binding subunit